MLGESMFGKSSGRISNGARKCPRLLTYNASAVTSPKTGFYRAVGSTSSMFIRKDVLHDIENTSIPQWTNSPPAISQDEDRGSTPLADRFFFFQALARRRLGPGIYSQVYTNLYTLLYTLKSGHVTTTVPPTSGAPRDHVDG